MGKLGLKITYMGLFIVKWRSIGTIFIGKDQNSS